MKGTTQRRQLEQRTYCGLRHEAHERDQVEKIAFNFSFNPISRVATRHQLCLCSKVPKTRARRLLRKPHSKAEAKVVTKLSNPPKGHKEQSEKINNV